MCEITDKTLLSAVRLIIVSLARSQTLAESGYARLNNCMHGKWKRNATKKGEARLNNCMHGKWKRNATKKGEPRTQSSHTTPDYPAFTLINTSRPV